MAILIPKILRYSFIQAQCRQAHRREAQCRQAQGRLCSGPSLSLRHAHLIEKLVNALLGCGGAARCGWVGRFGDWAFHLWGSGVKWFSILECIFGYCRGGME